MPTRLGVTALAVVTALFMVLTVGWAWGMLATGQPVGVAIGVALAVLCALGVWGLWQELRFGVRAERLGRRLEAEGGLPPERVEVLPSGRVRARDGHALFPKYRDEAQADPDDWRAWYRLGLVYDAAGDRRRARAAILRAVGLERKAQRSASAG